MKRQFFVDHGSAMSHNLDNWKARGNKRVRTGWAVFFLCLTLVAPSTCLADSQQKFPGKGTKAAWERANQLNHEGLVLGDKNQLNAAIAKAKEAIQTYPFDGVYYYNLGNYLTDAGNYSDAVIQYKKALALEPQNYYYNFNLGLAYRKMSNNKMAEISYRKALALRADDFDLFYSLGNVLRDQEKYGESREMYDRAGHAANADSVRLAKAYSTLKEKADKSGGLKH